MTSSDMRKTPVYSLEGDMGNWLNDHNGIMFNEVLESVESAIDGEHSLDAIPVVILRSEGGTTLFMLKSIGATLESIQKAMDWFVDSEEYEKAARARDAKRTIELLVSEDHL